MKKNIATTLNEFLNENNNSSINLINGNTYYYKNQYMNDSIKLVLKNKEEFESGELIRAFFKKENGETLELTKYEIKYLSDKPFEIDGYTYGKMFDEYISNIIGFQPKQTHAIIKLIENKKTSDIINLSFTEEVKDGRTPKFNINKPLSLKNRTFTYKGITTTITDIKYIETSEQPSDYNQYINYIYDITVNIEYKNL